VHKTVHHHQDGYKAHVAVEPDTGLFTAGELIKVTGDDNHEAMVGLALLDDEPDPPDVLDVLGDSAYGTGDARAALAEAGHTAVINPRRCPSRHRRYDCTSVVIDTAADKVFDSMIRPDVFRKWSGANVEIEHYVGGRIAMGGFEPDPGGVERTGPQADPAVRRRRDHQLGAGRLRRQDRLTMVHSGFDPANPPYPGWAVWLGDIARAAALPRAAAPAFDLAPDRDRRCPRGHVRYRPVR
jgi:hypothetical protein